MRVAHWASDPLVDLVGRQNGALKWSFSLDAATLRTLIAELTAALENVEAEHE